IVTVACVRTLAAIARNDFEGVQAVLALLRSNDPQVRYAAVCAVPSLKQAQPGAKALILIAQADPVPKTRLAAITALVSIADADNRASIKACLDGLTLDRDPVVRQAAETALEALPKKLGRPEERDAP
ncbi:MAG TPA: hypothetical protein VFA18_10700, partial [Gemmataceae bacterium]|nr:hypothetical protein [Gemmataceae bacterium]